MDNAALREVAGRFGTPLYIYDLREVRTRAEELRASLPPSAELLYSLKANPLPPLAAHLRAAGCQAEVSSPRELRTALDAGYPADRMLYTGPGKSPVEIAEALVHGVVNFSCESTTELRRLSATAMATGVDAHAVLRVQPVERPAAGLSMADGRQFGFDATEAIAACRTPLDGVTVRGFHVYLGSQLADVDALARGFEIARDTVERVCHATGIRPEIVDLGGGFPWPYATAGVGHPLAGLAERIDSLLAGWAPVPWFESGRRLVASAGWLLTSVVDVKERSDGAMVVVDAGINALGGMAGLGRVLRPSTGFENLSGDGARERITAAVVGPLCTPADRLAVRATVEQPRVGDVLAVPNVGAYGLTASLTAFLSRPVPAEVVFDDGELVGVWQLASGHRAMVDAGR